MVLIHVTDEQVPGTGDVIGPGSSIVNRLALFVDGTGKVIKQGTVTHPSANKLAEIDKLQAVSANIDILHSDASIGVRLHGSASGVNYLDILGTTTGVPPSITAKGETNVGIDIVARGTGDIRLIPITGKTIITGVLDVTGGANFSGTVLNINATNPAFGCVDTTNTCIVAMQAQDTFGFFGTTSNHPVNIAVNNSIKVRITASGNMAIGVVTDLGRLHVDQNSTGGAIPVLYLDQADLGQPMIEFNTTIQTGGPIEEDVAKTLTTTHFIKVVIPTAGTVYIPCGTIA